MTEPLKVELCAGTACHLMGASDLLEALRSLPAAAQQLLSVQLTHCLGACGKGPNVRVAGVVYSHLNGEELQQLVLRLLEGRDEK